MTLKPIGVLVFSGSRIVVGRADRSDYSFDGMDLCGLKKVLAESGLKYEFCSAATLNEYDHVVCSLTSFHDVLNLLLSVKPGKKPCIHVGGPACNNINPLIDVIDTANFGRCDEGKLARIISGEKIPSVWRKDTDPLFEAQYEVDSSSASGLSGKETSFGCPKKCSFCFYSHWNGHVTSGKGAGYASGKEFAKHNREDFFKTLDWATANQGATTALDGLSERSRELVCKPCSTGEIKDKLLESNSVTASHSLRAKIYCIASFPWETEHELKESDITKAIADVANDLKNKMTLVLRISHFIPFQKTPMWYVPFNWADVRRQAKARPLLFSNERIRLFSGGTYTPSPAVAAQSTIIQRAGRADRKTLMVLASSKWRGLSSSMQCAAMRRELSRFFVEQSQESIPNITTPNKIKYIQYPCLT